MNNLADRLAKQLQRDLALRDMMDAGPPQLPKGVAALLVLRLQHLKLKMYQERGHALPHLHVDYGPEYHAASYCIDPPYRLEGELSGKYESTVIRFIMGHKDELLELWSLLQDGASHEIVLAQLQEADA